VLGLRHPQHAKSNWRGVLVHASNPVAALTVARLSALRGA